LVPSWAPDPDAVCRNGRWHSIEKAKESWLSTEEIEREWIAMIVLQAL
jgi:hypothetical protein